MKDRIEELNKTTPPFWKGHHSCRACWENTVEYYRELWQEVYR